MAPQLAEQPDLSAVEPMGAEPILDPMTMIEESPSGEAVGEAAQVLPLLARSPAALHRRLMDDTNTLRPWVDLAKAFEDEYKGGQSGYDVKGQRIYNLVQEMLDSVEPDLSPEEVRPAASANRGSLSMQAEVLARLLDQPCREADITGLAAAVAHELLFAPCAVVRVGRHEGLRTAELDGEEMSVQEPFAHLVPLEGLALDMTARHWKHRTYCAERIVCRKSRLPGLLGVDPPEYAALGIPAGTPVMSRAEAAEWLASRTPRPDDGLSGSAQSPEATRPLDEDDETVQLWYAAVYDGNRVYVVIIPDTQGAPPKFLSCRLWSGHPRGPFEFARVKIVRDSLLGVPLLASIFDLHQAAVKLGNKLVRQLLNLKNLAVADKSNKDDAMTVKQAQDQELVLLNNTKGATVLSMGGTRPELYEGLSNIERQFGNQSGNVRQNGGTEQAGDTATVATYLQAGGAKRVRRAASAVRGVIGNVVGQFAYRMFFAGPEDAVGVPGFHTLEWPVPGDKPIRLTIESPELAADVLDFSFTIDAWGAQTLDPSMRRAAVTQFLELVARLMPLVQVGAVRPEALATIGREEYGIRNVDQILADFTGRQVAVESIAFGSLPVPPMPGMTAGIAMLGTGMGMGGGGGGMPGVSGMNRGRRPIDQTRSMLAPTQPRPMGP